MLLISFVSLLIYNGFGFGENWVYSSAEQEGTHGVTLLNSFSRMQNITAR